ncbi:hypothetical protein FPSE5266_20392 [Fusarium pseudograminearum]|nr:hypothetical protein FPSE5266_20392 [Fusarium pseudograminearum]
MLGSEYVVGKEQQLQRKNSLDEISHDQHARALQDENDVKGYGKANGMQTCPQGHRLWKLSQAFSKEPVNAFENLSKLRSNGKRRKWFQPVRETWHDLDAETEQASEVLYNGREVLQMNNQTLTQRCVADVGHAHLNRDGIEFQDKDDKRTVR